jgi:RHS repeat-associated protein
MRIGEEKIEYSYDELYQLTSETGTFAHNYLFDALNNRLQKDEDSYQINDLQQVVSHLQYDRNGNPTQKGDTTYTYDAFDRLVRVETPTFLQAFKYDALHRCLSKITWKDGVQETRYFLYDGQNEIGSLDEQLSLVELRVLGSAPHAEIGASIALELNGLIYEPIHDLQGNLATLSSLERETASRCRYSTFGEEQVTGSILSPWRFSSKRVDLHNELINFGRRYYLPELGRWLTPDPSGFDDGMNLYAYLHNAPLTNLDEYGLITYVHGKGWQSDPWGSPFSYVGSNPGKSFASESWNLSRVDSRLIPSLDLYDRYSPHYYVNGIQNSWSDSRRGAGVLSRTLGEGANVIPIYSQSFGRIKDMFSVDQSKKNYNCSLPTIGFVNGQIQFSSCRLSYSSFAVKRINREIRFSSSYMDALQDPRKIFLTAFSRGAADTFHAVKTLSPEQKYRLIITACGPIMILPRNLGFSVTNLISSGDGCSLACNPGLKSHLKKYRSFADVEILPFNFSPSRVINWDHYFSSPRYQEGIKKYLAPKYVEYGELR